MYRRPRLTMSVSNIAFKPMKTHGLYTKQLAASRAMMFGIPAVSPRGRPLASPRRPRSAPFGDPVPPSLRPRSVRPRAASRRPRAAPAPPRRGAVWCRRRIIERVHGVPQGAEIAQEETAPLHSPHAPRSALRTDALPNIPRNFNPRTAPASSIPHPRTLPCPAPPRTASRVARASQRALQRGGARGLGLEAWGQLSMLRVLG